MKNSKHSKYRSKHDSKPSPSYKADKSEQQSLNEFLEGEGVKNWDFIIIGDGSGSNWNREAGWASVSIERATGERLVWCGGVNRGTVNMAEIMAYLHPLNWLAAREDDKRSKHKGRRQAYQIHIFTDSDYCRATGSSKNRMVTKNGGLWKVMDCYVSQGFVLNWHFKPRSEIALNRYCDRLSKLVRLLHKKYNLQERMEAEAEASGASQTVYDINPLDG